MKATWGEGSSPALYKNKLVIVANHEGQSKIFVLDKNSGEILWEKDPDEISTWATPLVIEVEGKPQIIVNGKERSRGYDLGNGEVIWNIQGLGGEVIASPVFDGERAFLMDGTIAEKKLIQAINMKKAKGNLDSSDAVIWTHDKDASYVPSPLLVNDKLYFLKVNSSQLSCFDAKTGQKLFHCFVKYF